VLAVVPRDPILTAPLHIGVWVAVLVATTLVYSYYRDFDLGNTLGMLDQLRRQKACAQSGSLLAVGVGFEASGEIWK